jgi:hypothetical protein
MSLVKPEFYNFSAYTSDNKNDYMTDAVSTFFNVDHFDFGGIFWDLCLYVKKANGYIGHIHIDNPKDFWPAVNIVIDGVTLLDIWDPEDLKDEQSYIEGNGKNYYLKCFDTKIPPRHTYTLEKGVFLLNTGVPHRARVPHGVRHMFSIRSTKIIDKNWNWTLDQFNALLIE